MIHASPRFERIALVVVSIGFVVVSSALAWVLWRGGGLELRHEEAQPIAEALQGETEASHGAWPPVATDLASGLASSRDAGSLPRDAALDAALDDAGPPLPAPVERAGFHVRQGSRDGLYYLEVVIGDASFDDRLPMVVMIHGRGGSAQIPGGPFLGLSHPVRVIVPQAPDRLGQGWQWLPVYVGQGLVDRLASTLFQTTARLAAMLRALAADRPTVGRIIVSGFSQGGLITLTMALYDDDLVGHAFPLASWIPPPLEPVDRRVDLDYPTIRSMHGTADAVIPVGPTRAMYERLAALGYDVELVEFPGVGHAITPAQNQLFHHWLDAAVCRTVGDEVGAVLAEIEALRVLEADLPDAGYPDDVPRIDADLDAWDEPTLDVGARLRRRGRERDASTASP